MLFFLSSLIHFLDWHANILERYAISNSLISGEEPDNPSIDEARWSIWILVRVFPLVIDIVPKLDVGISFVRFDELIYNW